jgi:arginine-tRNA-protein transferase
MSTLLPRFAESFLASHMPAPAMDALWAQGWRHQGSMFFRYTHCLMEGVEHNIVPLRIDVNHFHFSKSQRRVWRRNDDVRWEVVPTEIDEVMSEVFEKHTTRFVENVPGSLHDFLGDSPSNVPCRCYSVKAWLGDRLAAASFVDLGMNCMSSVYAIFDPEFAKRGLGTLTLLKEIDIARRAGKRFIYHGFGTPRPSRYDYKQMFRPIEGLDWVTGNWMPLAEVPVMMAHRRDETDDLERFIR